MSKSAFENHPPSSPHADSSDKPVLTTDQAAAYLQMSKRQLQELAYQRQVGYIKCGRLVRFRKCDLDEFLERRLIAPFK